MRTSAARPREQHPFRDQKTRSRHSDDRRLPSPPLVLVDSRQWSTKPFVPGSIPGWGTVVHSPSSWRIPGSSLRSSLHQVRLLTEALPCWGPPVPLGGAAPREPHKLETPVRIRSPQPWWGRGSRHAGPIVRSRSISKRPKTRLSTMRRNLTIDPRKRSPPARRINLTKKRRAWHAGRRAAPRGTGGPQPACFCRLDGQGRSPLKRATRVRIPSETPTPAARASARDSPPIARKGEHHVEQAALRARREVPTARHP